MKLWVPFLVIAAADVLALAAMLAVRARSPRGGYFSDTQRASGALAATGTVFAVMVGFCLPHRLRALRQRPQRRR